MIKVDCRRYLGHVPCKPHKSKGYQCKDCVLYDPMKERILIIKLGAAGDVIRTTPLLYRLKKEYPRSEITWLTYYPSLLSTAWVDNVLSFSIKDLIWLKAQKFTWLINLDKDREAIALTNAINARKKSGFLMDAFGKCRPADKKSSYRKWLTGIWDNLNKSNRKNYMEEIFNICGYEFNGEEYILEKTEERSWPDIDNTKKVIGLNTGCGNRWTTRLWNEDYWIELSRELRRSGFEVILLGGPQEHERNLRISKVANVKYLGFFELPVFIDLVGQCDAIVTQVTMALHIAIGLRKIVILMNNIFNKNEFFMYGRGEIVEPDLDCLCCFKPEFDDMCPVDNCMNLIKPDIILEKLRLALRRNEKQQKS